MFLWRASANLGWIVCCLAAIFGLVNGLGAFMFRGPGYVTMLIMVGYLLPVPLLATLGRGAYRYARGTRVAGRSLFRPVLSLLDMLLRETAFWLIVAGSSIMLACWVGLYGLWRAATSFPSGLAPGIFLFAMAWAGGSAALATVCHLLSCGPRQVPAALQRYIRQ